MNEGNARMNANAEGIVQGVFFRASAQKIACSLGISGYAKNLEDGSVEIVAEGEKKALEEFAEKLKQLKYPVEVRGLKVE